jgi:HTH-type transcriptional regulator, quorum sensing regulator NprR
MTIHALQIKRLLKQRKHERLFETRPIGSAIKYKRKEMKMTLEEAAEGICSISYLSKLENNLIDVSDKFVDPLIKRFGITEYYNLKDLKFEDDKHLMFDAFLNFDEYPEEILNKYNKRKDIQAQLIKLGYYVSKKEYYQAERIIPDIKTYIPQLLDDEIAIFLYCLHKILYAYGRYYDAYDFLASISSQALEDDKIRLLFLKGRLKNAYKLHMIAEIMNTFPVFFNLCHAMQYHNILFDVQFEQLLFEASYQSPKQIKKQIERMRKLDQRKANYILANSLYHHQDFESLVPLLEQNNAQEDGWLLLNLLTLDQLQKKDKLISLIQADLSEHCSVSLKIVHRHLRYKYISNKEETLNYLRRDILGLRYIIDDHFILSYLLSDAQKMFSERHFYKEAVQVSTKLMPKIKYLQKIQSQHILPTFGA